MSDDRPDLPGPEFAHGACGHGCFAIDLDCQTHGFVSSVGCARLAIEMRQPREAHDVHDAHEGD